MLDKTYNQKLPHCCMSVMINTFLEEEGSQQLDLDLDLDLDFFFFLGEELYIALVPYVTGVWLPIESQMYVLGNIQFDSKL